ncbi:MAG: bifunctional oligoribonuclease/PAP phosphatase NrnA [Ignavibacteriaceae bacterium]|nr:MAG: bifunctional oligoribonuclease/PAP phosphatase NrnA [Chlorobiota bacterium]MBV6399077.1 Bifunctional oligoribonuclease and PAP phosphatase NrnA [Ignavibacteria bacterium]MCC6885295.1 bifunctional oligoribonuclease/PAP phosphatase NrnA [Ignavibacteriales bacterium]MCE7953302.1 bifunctional oligoribonuclease/PAP phosphatase NrnA [Chlorobi bacterium CHB7]MDL1887280.1 bifunctional oligoribonuclease/PAP phosphatase NrnA [Ignavibacteria bacterium CHB1]MEB2330155.1 bifunctional oligoribonucle
MIKSFNELKKAVLENSNFILTTHVIPDGDAIGSVMAFDNYLKQNGKNVTIINHSPTPKVLQFLDDKNLIVVFPDEPERLAIQIENAEVIILCDANEYSRTRSMEDYIRKSSAVKICIDHHTGLIESEFDIAVCNIQYAATCQLIYDYLKFDNENFINHQIATYLYAGIMTDTGSFRFPRTTSEVMRICADLIDKGADPVLLHENIYDRMSKPKLNLLQRFLKSFEFHFNDEVVTSHVSERDFKETGAELNDVEGFTSYLMGIENVKMGILLAEFPKGVKVSIRSKGNIPVNELAREFGGGGHLNAAGVVFDKLPTGQIINTLLKSAEKFFNNKLT